MNSFEYYSPTKVLFGKGTQQKVAQEIKAWGGSRVLVHYGSGSVVRSGLLAQVERSLTEAGLFYCTLGGVVPNPRLSLIEEGIALCRKEAIDFVLAIGGGSTIDSAKAIAIGTPYEGEVWDFYSGKGAPKTALPIGSILTIAAAGSETSQSSVITKEEGSLKRGFNHALQRPRFALMNPELLYTLPAYQTACGVVDILMHTLERYFSPGGQNEMTDRIAEALMRTVIEYGPLCVEEPQNYEALSEVMWAGSLSHNTLTGLGRAGDWATHQIEHELGGLYDVAHGAGLAAVWGSWARFVRHADIHRFVRYAKEVWGIEEEEADLDLLALAAIEKTEAFFASLDMPTSIIALLGKAPSSQELQEMAIKCNHFGSRQVGGLRKLGEEDLYQIYQAAL